MNRSPSTTLSSAIRRRRAAAGAGVLTLTLTLALTACGSEDAEPAVPPVRTAADGSEFNQADVDFATEMIPHHAQAIEMVVMAQGRDLDPPVARLMDGIREAQVPEVETMTDWLTAWGEPVPPTSLDHANANADADGGRMSSMPGTMDPEAMSRLEEMRGSGFQDMWLEMMTEHHRSAVKMAEDEVADGHHPEAVALAEQITETQTAEIDAMQELL